ncbi:nitrate- and nitrite sensing domain-containing protein, partial [Noviherbaspirillum sp. ST9]|uniref:nitrate- and nitrite sensing domain-containing protein n=1 Tax=Noviherbaspirillum sp. ST9 TaxID=3401606 RepID=UPI003B586D00
EDLQRFNQLSGGQNAELAIVDRFGAPAQATQLQALRAGSETAEVERLRSSIIKGVSQTGEPAVDPRVWYDTATRRINRLHELEQSSAQIVAARADTAVVSAQTSLIVSEAIAVVAFLTAGVLSWAAARSITRPLKVLTGELKVLASGRTDISLASAARRDEFGEIGEAIGLIRKAAVDKAAQEASAVAEQARLKSEVEHRD